ncbi:MAG: hypothetical protein RIN55_10025 [Tissierellaceae bacterium]|nr:hypothetical protein [Tissierellaceae bacterium]
MGSTKNIAIGALFAVIAALFQLMPFFFSEFFVFLTIFSAIPIYIVSRINPKSGVLSYFTACLLIITLSVHEGIFFLSTNGIIGLTLGICSYYMKRRVTIWTVGSIVLATTLIIMNYCIEIPILGIELPGSMIIQMGIIFTISIVSNILYYYFSDFIYNILKKNLKNH